MDKLGKIPGDMTFCNAGIVVGISSGCINKDKCKRFIGNYEDDGSAHWYFTASACINNGHDKFLPISVDEAYKKLNLDLNK